MKVKISKTFGADIAHTVPTQDLSKLGVVEKCKRLHGHTISITASICGDIDDRTGMVLDYNFFKGFKEFIDTFLDHHYIKPYSEISKFPDDESTLEYRADYVLLAITSDKISESYLRLKIITAETLACFLAYIFYTVVKEYIGKFDYIEMEVKETPNTSAVFRMNYDEIDKVETLFDI